MNEEVRRAIGRRLKEARNSVCLKQEDVGAKLGLERQAVSSWERGKTMPKCNEWFELGIMYGASLDYLVYGIRTVPVSRFGLPSSVTKNDACQILTLDRVGD